MRAHELLAGLGLPGKDLRAEIGLSMLDRYYPEAASTQRGAVFPGIPAGNPAKEDL